MFWRWAGVDPTAKLADFDEAATIGGRQISPLYLLFQWPCCEFLYVLAERASRAVLGSASFLKCGAKIEAMCWMML